VSDRATAIIGFTAAAGVLILLADTAPRLALALAGVLGLGVALSHSQDIAQVIDTFNKAVKKA